MTEDTVYSTTGTQKYSVQCCRVGKIQFYSTTGMEKSGGENHVKVSKKSGPFWAGTQTKAETLIKVRPLL